MTVANVVGAMKQAKLKIGSILLGLGLALMACLPAYAQQEERPQPRRFPPRFYRQQAINQEPPPIPPSPAAPVIVIQPGKGPPPGAEFRGIRLSPEERRQLRRDIREHGRDLYRVPQPHP